MVRSKWNCGKSIPIDGLSEAELKVAIPEWAEGNQTLEELLWLCHKKGVETVGCDAGDHHFAYIDVALKSDRDNLCKLLNAAINMKRCGLMFSFNGNPRSGSNWYETHISIFPNKKEDTQPVFTELCTALKKPWGKKPSEVSKQLLNITDFLEDKESGLGLRLYERPEGYLFAIECWGNQRNWTYFTELFVGAGLHEMHNKKPDVPVKAWGIKTKNVFELSCALRSVYEHMRLKWKLSLPEEFTEDMSFNDMALMMRRKFGTDEAGVEKLNEWVRNNWGKPYNEITY